MTTPPPTHTAPIAGPIAGRPPRRWHLPWRVTMAPRRDVRPRHTVAALVVGLGVGLGLTVLMLAASGVPPRDVLNEFVIFTFFTAEGLSLTMVAATPLIVVGLAAAAALRVGFWNIGIEGQVWMGAIFATWVAVTDAGAPEARLLLMALAAMAGGMLGALPPLILKRRLGVNEIITTLLLNYVAALLVQHLVFGVWKDPASSFPYSDSYQPGVERLAQLGWGKVHVGLIAALMIAGLLWLVAERSRIGAWVAAVGADARVAFACGLPVAGVIAGSVLLSGALAGLGGFMIAAGQEFRLTQALATGTGFSAIVIAFLARFGVLPVVVVAILTAGLYVAGDTAQVFYQLPRAVVLLIQGVILVSMVSADMIARYGIRIRANRSPGDV
ncbi:ABC transporter permease [Tistrella bauzanensis]|uniref:ABC transporter permease n=1 Tax=Tistrella TaxID=171436 RepID=UPI0031F6A142